MHAHHHGHSHHDRHGPHGHMPKDFGRAFAVGIALNLGYIVIEATYGLLTGSMALLADAGHNLSDVLGLGVAWAGAELAKRPPTKKFTYGLGGSSILAALLNALLLLVAIGAIAWEAVQRLNSPSEIAGKTVMIVAAIGIFVNLGTAMMFMKGQKEDANIRGAFLHMAADAAVSAGVVVGGAIIYFTGANWVDPIISLFIVVIIFWSTWGLLRDSIKMSLQAVPDGIDSDAVYETLRTRPGVTAVHDLHIWPMSTNENAMTAHLVVPAGHPGDDFLVDAQTILRQQHNIHHITIQIEMNDEELGHFHSNCDFPSDA